MFVVGSNDKECVINAFINRDGTIDCSFLNDLWHDLDNNTQKKIIDTINKSKRLSGEYRRMTEEERRRVKELY